MLSTARWMSCDFSRVDLASLTPASAFTVAVRPVGR